MANSTYSEIENTGVAYWFVFSCFALLVIGGLCAFSYIHHHGHYVTGMNNQIVWGMPHVFAIFLIVAASGAANVATVGTVFGKQTYQPLGRLSLFLAASLLIGGLVVLLLDLGHIGHVIEMAKGALNFKSIFAWNMILYSGFIKPLGIVNLIWRFLLTMATGSIFGFLIARQYYDAAILAPLFIAASYVFGTAIYTLLLIASCKLSSRPLGNIVLEPLRSSLPIFISLVLFFELVRHLTNLYATEHHGVETFILSGNTFSTLFWFGQIMIGSLVPLFLLWSPLFKNNRFVLIIASALVIIGGFIQIYVILIGGQSYPLVLFPNAETNSSFADGVFNAYSATLPEYLLGIGGIGIAFCLVLLGMKVLRLLPSNLSDTE